MGTTFTLHSHYIHTTFTLHSHYIHTTFTLHLHIDGASSRSFERHFFHQQQLQDQHHLDLMSLERQEYGHNGVYEMALAAPMGQVHHVPETEEPFGSFSSKSLEPLYVDPGRMRQNKGKRPPPPPRRSRDTQLSYTHLAV